MENNTNTDPALEPLRDAIKGAFADVPIPTTRLFVPYDSYEKAIIKKFGRKHWSQVDVYQLNISTLGLYLLAPEWFHFYLPAYLLSAMRAAENPDSMDHFWERVTALLGELKPPNNPKFHRRFEKRMELLSPEQRAAMILFVRYAIHHLPDRSESLDGPSIHDLLAVYWLEECD